MSTKQILNVFKQAIVTFPLRSAPSAEIFNNNFKQLKTLVDQISKEHVNLDSSLLKAPELKGPCTYIKVYEDAHVNISIFVVRPGHKLPLHDHPHMHGLLKVIAGTVRIQTYTADKSLTSKLENEVASKDNINGKVVAALKHSPIICNEKSECCVLTPDDGNFHEITPVEGPAAFLDVLSPPYETDLPDIGTRQCTYYQEVAEIKPNVIQLSEIPQPQWFWCESASYKGPHLMNLLEENQEDQSISALE